MMTNAGCFSLFLDKIRDLLRCFWRETEPHFIDHNFYRSLNKKYWQKQSIPMQRFSPFKVFDCYACNTFAELIYSVENSIGKKARAFNDGNYTLVDALDSERIDEMNQS